MRRLRHFSGSGVRAYAAVRMIVVRASQQFEGLWAIREKALAQAVRAGYRGEVMH